MQGPYICDKKWNALEASRKKVPRYLFRAFGPRSGGGGEKLNSVRGIIPRAFVNGNGHRNVREIPNLGYMLGRHLAEDKIETEFSSWAASLALVLSHAINQHKNGYVCVLDRALLPDVTIYHVPSLKKAMQGTEWDFYPYPEEYLAHGRIEEPGFKAVSVQTLQHLGTYRAIPILNEYTEDHWWSPHGIPWVTHSAVAIRVEEVRTMRRIAEHFGSKFTVIMTAALLSITRRGRVNETEELLPADIQAFRAGLDELIETIPLQALKSMFTRNVYVNGFDTVAQMMDLLKGLIQLEKERRR